MVGFFVRRLAMLCATLLFTGLAHAARADCTAALSNFDTGVCQVPAFNDADKSLTQAYQQLLNALPAAQQTQLRHDELGWIDQRDRQCATSLHGNAYVDFNCATNMTLARLSALKEQLAVPDTTGTVDGEYTVQGSTMPWLWAAGGLNSAYRFGIQDGTEPAIVSLAEVNAKPGQTLIITYVAGQICIGPGWPQTDANGARDGGAAATGRPLPSVYMQDHAINLSALVGAFTDKQGQLVAPPFAVGDGPASVIIPPGATQLQLGINDDIYADNIGALTVSVKQIP